MQARWKLVCPNDIQYNFDESETFDMVQTRLQDALDRPAYVREDEHVAVFWYGEDLRVQGGETLGSVATRIGEREHLAPGDPSLAFAVYLKIPEIVLNVLRLDGQCCRISVAQRAKIRTVKHEIERLTSIPNNEQQLASGTVILEDEKTLTDYNIHHESTLSCVQLPR